MINPKEPLKEVTRFLVTPKDYDDLKLLKSILNRPMAELCREGLTLVFQKYNQHLKK